MESISRDTNVIFYTTDSTEYGRNTADICQNYCAEHFGSSKTAPVIMSIKVLQQEIMANAQ